MNEGRIVLCVFGVAALILIAAPIGMLVTASPVLPDAEAMNGEVSRLFLAAQQRPAPDRGRRLLPEIAGILPPGLPSSTAFERLAASGFSCVPDAQSATCFRSTDLPAACRSEWRVSLTFQADGTTRSSEADSRATCP